MKKVPLSFYDRKDVVKIAGELLGKIIVTNFDGNTTSGRIVETEAYTGLTDRASHSFGGRRTARNEHMYSSPGTAYVYICYGMHQMFNITTNKKEIPDAVLIRAVEPVDGITIMAKRTGKKITDNTLSRGPGNVGKALGIYKHHSGLFLLDKEIYLLDDNHKYQEEEIGVSKRIGVESAGADALLPYRFYVKRNKYVSGKNN
ncbi:MAG TPA: DNA-3-methyladenine glycosylase [Hanamia sp.]|nr:DNA-3-methyladenine glycosylase [Hanamia sp.]